MLRGLDNKMSILITGGLGYLGARLTFHLQEKGYNVLVGTRKEIKNYKVPLNEKNFVKMDWDCEFSLKSSVKGIDTIIHTAGISAKLSIEKPSEALKVNGLYTSKLIDIAIENHVKRFIYISTVHVYKEPLTGDIDESSTTNNLHPYATSKIAGEKAVLYAKQLGLIQGIVLRLSNGSGHPVFPDTECWHLLLNDLCKQAVQKKELILKSESSLEINLIPMTNVCLGIEHFLQLPEDHLDDSPFNICSNKNLTLYQVAHQVSERSKVVLGYDVEISFKNKVEEKNNTRRLYLNNTKSEKTGLNFQENLVQEIDDTLFFCKSHFSTNS